MFITRLFALLSKNIRYLWRRKSWTLLDVVIPLALSMCLFSMFSRHFKTNVIPETVFKSFQVTGNYEDLKRKVGNVSSIYDYYNKKSSDQEIFKETIQFGNAASGDAVSDIDSRKSPEKPLILCVAYNKTVRLQVIKPFVEALRKRYVSNETGTEGKSLLSVLWFNSETELRSFLLASNLSSSNLSNCIGGLVIKRLDIIDPKIEYEFIMNKTILNLSAEFELEKTPWYGGNPYFIYKSDNAASAAFANFWSCGVLSLQYAIDELFIQRTAKPENLINFSVKLQKMPYPKYSDKSWKDTLPLLVIFWPVLALSNVVHGVSRIAQEKDNGMAAYLQMLGLGFLEFHLSHGILIFLKLSIIFLPCAFILLPYLVVISSSLFFVSLVTYMFGIVCVVIFLSSIFRATSSASKGAFLAWISSVVLQIVCEVRIPRTRILRSLIASLNINFAFARTTEAIIDYMMKDLFLGLSNCFDESQFFFTFGLGIIMMLVDIIWMTLVAVYLDNLYPPGELSRKSFFYVFPRCCGFEEKSVDMEYDIDEFESNDNFEPESNFRDANELGVDVIDLTKVYGAVRAVNSFSFQAYRGNVTVLLGHNGAGKSTTLAMLAGLVAPTAGTIKICGTELNSSTLKQCQKKLSFCPQYNPIFDLLTAREHLNLCRKLKGNPQNIVDDLLKDLRLKDKANEFAGKLNEGLKRKLSIAMSLVGGSEVILLDEPTAGLDFGARRLVHDVLEKYKAGRTIILTTHCMDEADRVGDRISIMVRGSLFCSGSPEFLKARYSAGYLLTIALNQNSYLSNMKEHILKTVECVVEDLTVQSETPQGLTLVLPVEHKPKFPALFKQLENNGPAFGIDSFCISLNTLEQVFHRVGDLAADTGPSNSHSIEVAKRLASRICDSTQRSNHGFRLCTQQLSALMEKHFIYILRKLYRFLIQIAIPLLLLLLLTYPSVGNIEHKEEIATEEFVVRADELAPAAVLFQMESPNNNFARNLRGLITKAGGYEPMDFFFTERLERYILDRPKVMPPLALGFIIRLTTDDDSFLQMIDIQAFFNGNAKRGPVIALNTISNARLGKASDAIVVSLKPLDNSPVKSIRPPVKVQNKTRFLKIALIIVFSFLVSGFITEIVREKKTNFMHQQLLTGLSSFVYWLSIYLINSLTYLFACILLIGILVINNFNLSGWVYILLGLYFWASMSFVCCVSFFFSSPIKAYTFMMIYTLILPIFSFATQVAIALYKPWLKSITDTSFMILETNYALVTGLNTLMTSGPRPKPPRFPALMLLISGVVFLLFLIVLQTKLISLCIVRLRGSQKSEAILPTEDADVTDERERVRSIPAEEFAVSVYELNKFYGSFHALKNLSFGVRTDECFGLLGADGAGKTTAFEILTGKKLSSGGVIKVNDQPSNKIKMLGFCPQYDALPENLTGKETLRLLIKLRGYTNVEERIKDVLEAISLERNADKLISQYSGGQRRRLSVGLALVSQGRVVMLDEPTAGIDPKARRKIWDLLIAMRERNYAMLLTSHSMEECEVLCTRIGILIKGSLAAIGTPQHLKSKFNQGCTLILKLKDLNQSEQLIEAVSATFPDAVLKTVDSSINLAWHLQRTDKTKWSQIFEKVHRFASSRVEVADYFLDQPTLEDAFIELSQPDDSTAHKYDSTPAPRWYDRTPAPRWYDNTSTARKDDDTATISNFDCVPEGLRVDISDSSISLV